MWVRGIGIAFIGLLSTGGTVWLCGMDKNKFPMGIFFGWTVFWHVLVSIGEILNKHDAERREREQLEEQRARQEQLELQKHAMTLQVLAAEMRREVHCEQPPQ